MNISSLNTLTLTLIFYTYYSIELLLYPIMRKPPKLMSEPPLHIFQQYLIHQQCGQSSGSLAYKQRAYVLLTFYAPFNICAINVLGDPISVEFGMLQKLKYRVLIHNKLHNSIQVKLGMLTNILQLSVFLVVIIHAFISACPCLFNGSYL